jgi:hypothetical protein
VAELAALPPTLLEHEHGRPMKQLSCEGCGRRFEVPQARGRYPRQCWACDPAGHEERRRDRAARAMRAELEPVFRRDGAEDLAPLLRQVGLAALEQRATAGRAGLRAAITRAAHALGTVGLRSTSTGTAIAQASAAAATSTRAARKGTAADGGDRG